MTFVSFCGIIYNTMCVLLGYYIEGIFTDLYAFAGILTGLCVSRFGSQATVMMGSVISAAGCMHWHKLCVQHSCVYHHTWICFCCGNQLYVHR